jgi:hypothetical protein
LAGNSKTWAFERKKLLTSKFVSSKCSNCPLIFEFPAKYEQKIKKVIGHSEEKTSQKFGKSQGQPPKSIDADMICACSKNAHKRFEAVVKADGGYIEKKINSL